MAKSPLFGELLRHYRLQAGLTQVELARRAGVAPSYTTLLETGRRRNPSREVVKHFTDALGLADSDKDALYAAAGYAPSHDAPASAPRRHPVYDAMENFLKLGRGSPELPEAVERIVTELLGAATHRGAGPDARDLLRGLRLAGVGYFHSEPTEQHKKTGGSEKNQLPPNQAKLASRLGKLLRLLTDWRVPVSKRIALADQLISFAEWKLQPKGSVRAEGHNTSAKEAHRPGDK